MRKREREETKQMKCRRGLDLYAATAISVGLMFHCESERCTAGKNAICRPYRVFEMMAGAVDRVFLLNSFRLFTFQRALSLAVVSS